MLALFEPDSRTWTQNSTLDVGAQCLGQQWMLLEQAASGKTPTFEVKYKHVVVLYHHQELLRRTFVSANGVTTSEKSTVLRAHVNLGHPHMKEFVRLLKAAGTRPDIIEYVLMEFVCEGCLKEKRQPARLPAATPRTYDFNIVVGRDLLFVTGALPQEKHPVLNNLLWHTLQHVHHDPSNQEILRSGLVDVPEQLGASVWQRKPWNSNSVSSKALTSWAFSLS